MQDIEVIPSSDLAIYHNSGLPTHCSYKSRGRIYVKGNRLLPFAKNIGKNIKKNLIGKFTQKLIYRTIDHSRRSKTDGPKTASKKELNKQQ